MFRPACLGIVLWLSSACGGGSGGDEPYVDPAPHNSGYVTVSGGVKLHYLDFGGTGDALVLLAGGGNSAHVYDDWALRLVDSFHVVALTRRGYGQSSQPASGYDTATLASDIGAALDALAIPRAHLVGHSLGGNEMTRFAGDHPERVLRLVYLDAAYDRVDQVNDASLANPPAAPQPTEQDLASAAAFGAYIARIQGVALPEADIRATNHFAVGGGHAGSVTPASIALAVAGGETHLDYSRLQSPALAIYTVPDTVPDLFPWLTESSADWAAGQAYLAAAQAALAAQRMKFRDNAPAATSVIQEMHAVPHHLFLARPVDVAAATRAFLLGQS